MRAKRIVVAAALVALLSGGAALAADSRAAGDNSPTTNDSGTDQIYQSHGDGLKVARFRGRWDQVRYVPLEFGDNPVEMCAESPLARIVADMFGFSDIMQRCQPSD